jgi:hypothetical protein
MEPTRESIWFATVSLCKCAFSAAIPPDKARLGGSLTQPP